MGSEARLVFLLLNVILSDSFVLVLMLGIATLHFAVDLLECSYLSNRKSLTPTLAYKLDTFGYASIAVQHVLLISRRDFLVLRLTDLIDSESFVLHRLPMPSLTAVLPLTATYRQPH